MDQQLNINSKLNSIEIGVINIKDYTSQRIIFIIPETKWSKHVQVTGIINPKI